MSSRNACQVPAAETRFLSSAIVDVTGSEPYRRRSRHAATRCLVQQYSPDEMRAWHHWQFMAATDEVPMTWCADEMCKEPAVWIDHTPTIPPPPGMTEWPPIQISVCPACGRPVYRRRPIVVSEDMMRAAMELLTGAGMLTRK